MPVVLYHIICCMKLHLAVTDGGPFHSLIILTYLLTVMSCWPSLLEDGGPVPLVGLCTQPGNCCVILTKEGGKIHKRKDNNRTTPRGGGGGECSAHP